MRIRPLLSRSRSRRRRARASHRRSRRSRRHRRRHHRSGISHTITPFAHRRSLSRNHPPRPSSTVARIVIAHHESKMTMRAVARMKPESGRASTRPSLSRASSIDRSIASRCLRSRRARRSLPSSLERDNHISSHLIPFHSRHRAGGPSRPRAHRLDGPARAPFHVLKHHPVHQTKNNQHTRKKKIHTHKEPDRWRPTAPARARAASTRRSIAREDDSRSGDVDSSSRRDASLERDAFGRSTRRVRWTRATEEARGCVAREWDGARERRARCERARDGSRGAKGSRRGKGRRNAIEERARDAFVDRSGTIRGGRRLDGMKSNEEHSRFVRSNARPTNAGRGMDANDGERREMGD